MDFYFDGISSSTYGLYNVRLESGMISEPYFGARNLIKDKVYRKDLPTFYGAEKQPLTFKLTFSLLEGEWTDTLRFNIARWLIRDDYCSFYTEDKPDRIYYIICTNQGNLMTNGIGDGGQGYVEMEFESIAPYAFSPVYTNTHNLSTITSPTTIQISNLSNVGDYFKPEIEFKLEDTNTGVKIENLTVGGETLQFAGLTQGETVYINNETKEILSDITGSNPLDKCTSMQWLRLAYGVNNIQITGKCTLTVRMQYPLYI